MSDLQFDKAEFGSADAAAACAVCRTPLTGDYFGVNGQSLCPSCTTEVTRTLGGDAGSVGLLRAVAGGAAGGLAGALLFWGVSALSGYQFGLIAIVVGWLVGKGVQWGTGGHGSVLYQMLAVVITYLSIALSYLPELLSVEAQIAGPGYLLMLAVFTLFAPIAVSMNSIMGAIIIAIGLWEAWKIPKAIPLAVDGPFHAPVPVPAPAVPSLPPPPPA